MSTDTRAATLTEGLARRIREIAGGFPTTRVDTDLEQKVDANGFVVSVRRVGGDDAGWQSHVDLTLDVYCRDYAPLWDACDGISLLMLTTTGYIAGGWRVDRCTGTSWTEQAHLTLRAATATFRITTRDR